MRKTPHPARRWCSYGYYSPHGFIDYYVTEALGAYHGCHKALEQNALIYLDFLEKQHRAVHRLRRKAYEQEREYGGF
jgi:hypothetical protein